MSANIERIILAGFGGQGILFLGKVLAQVGMMSGKHVSWIPSYGPEMRGGTANCAVVISESEIASPLVTVPDTVIAMNRPSVDRFAHKIKAGGTLLYNSSLIDKPKPLKELRLFGIPANKIAEELGDARVANLVMAGAFARHSALLDIKSVLAGLSSVIPSRKKEMTEINRAAIEQGYAYESA